jgi:hypothetical protein
MKTEEIDLTYLLDNNEKTHEIVLTIRPITAMSISNNPGNQAFFSLQDFEDKIRGMIENMLNIDLPMDIRKNIIKLIKKKNKCNYDIFRSNGWFSVFTHVIDVNLLNPDVFDRGMRFDDLHKRLMRRPNTGVHLNGCENKTKLIHKLSKLAKENGVDLKKIRFIPQDQYDIQYDLEKNKIENGESDIKLINELLPSKSEFLTKEIFGKVPFFHKGVFNRENIVIKEDIIVKLSVTADFYDFFSKKYDDKTLRNDVYIGDSNSLVSINKIQLYGCIS